MTFNDDTQPGGVLRCTTGQAPFIKPDREDDYRVAWQFLLNESSVKVK